MIPVKALPSAKSRLAATVPDPAIHAALVRAIRADTVAAAVRAPGVARVVIVADAPPDPATAADAGEVSDGVADSVQVIVQTEPGLNAGLRAGARFATQHWPADAVAALMADLPALTPTDLGAALVAAATLDAAFVADSSGTGTTLLTAAPGTPLAPSFGAGSARRHGRHATSVVGAPGLRQDVDTEADLFRALELGVGPRTRAAAAAVTSCSR